MNAPFPQLRQTAAVRTLLDTSYRADALICGCDCATDPSEPGGIRVVFDGRNIPTVEITVCDGQVVGIAAIQALASALMDAEKMALRMAGVA